MSNEVIKLKEGVLLLFTTNTEVISTSQTKTIRFAIDQVLVFIEDYISIFRGLMSLSDQCISCTNLSTPPLMVTDAFQKSSNPSDKSSAAIHIEPFIQLCTSMEPLLSDGITTPVVTSLPTSKSKVKSTIGLVTESVTSSSNLLSSTWKTEVLQKSIGIIYIQYI
jgi:hypothetical protein